MRLYDRLWNQHGQLTLLSLLSVEDKMLDWLQECLRKAVVFDIANVANFISSEDPGKLVRWDDFPEVRPPFDICFFEYTLPMRDVEGGNEAKPFDVSSRRCGDLFICGNGNGIDEVVGTEFVRVLSLGEYVTDDPTKIGLLPTMYSYNIGHPRNGATFYLTNKSSDVDHVTGISKFTLELNSLRPPLMAISLLHCRNVKTTEHSSPPALNKRRIKRGKMPLVTYRTLEISAMSKTLQDTRKVEGVDLAKALHLCRGHFKEFTPDRPLFGKVTGKFWWPAHARGSLESGVVVKDYKVKP